MTKGQEIAQIPYARELAAAIDASIAEAVREARPSRCQEHKDVVPSLNSICEICDYEEAIAEAVRKRTVECAEELVRAGYKGSMVHREILAMTAPPAPAYPFAQPCKCWYLHTNGNYYRQRDNHSPRCLPVDAAYCEICGAARKGI